MWTSRISRLIQHSALYRTFISETVQEQWNEGSRTVGLTPKEQLTLRKNKPENVLGSRCLKVAIIGAPNAGKSTLANKLIGWRFAACSSKVHTTRHKAVGVLTQQNSQIVFLDTPGMIPASKLKKHQLEVSLLTDPYSAVAQSHLIIVLQDVSHVWGRSRLDPHVLKALYLYPHKRSILILNKVDLLKRKGQLLEVTRTLSDGLINGQKTWTTDAQQKPAQQKALFDHMRQPANIFEARQDNRTVYRGHSSEQYGNAENDYLTEDDYLVTVDDRDYHVKNFNRQSQLYGRTRNHSLNQSLDSELYTGSTREINVKDIEKKLNDVSKVVKNKIGWPNFEMVFRISALHGQGISELKEYMVSTAPEGSWQYHPSMVTDQNPIEMARMCVWEKLLDHLPAEIPYNLHVELSLWELDEDGMLRAVFEITCKQKRHLLSTIGTDGGVIRQVAREAKQELMNTFKRDITLRLLVRLDARQ